MIQCTIEAVRYLNQQRKISKGDFDQQEIIPESFMVSGYEWIGRLCPYSKEYRLVEYENRTMNKFGLQGKVGDDWKDVKCYDDGYDDYGKINPGKWVILADACSWSKG